MPQNWKCLCNGVPNTPKICCSTRYRPFFNFKSILSRYSKPGHPSPLAFILLSLEIFLFGIALFFGGGFRGAWASGRMNDVIAGRHTSACVPLILDGTWHMAHLGMSISRHTIQLGRICSRLGGCDAVQTRNGGIWNNYVCHQISHFSPIF